MKWWYRVPLYKLQTLVSGARVVGGVHARLDTEIGGFMAKVMEKAGARRLSTTHTARTAVRGKSKVTRPSSVAPKAGTAAKVIKVVSKPVPKIVPKLTAPAPAKKERTSMRPPAMVVPAQRTVAAVSSVTRVESARVNGSEHGVAVSRTDHLKARFAALSSASAQIKALKRTVQKNFFEIGSLLAHIRDEKLYEVKGYGSFESFVEREVDMDKVLCLRLARLAKTFVREAALEVGLERASAAMAALDGDSSSASSVASYPVSSSVSSGLPAHKR